MEMNFTAFFSYVLLTTFTPGPNNIMSMANAGKYGFKKSFPFNLGVFCGFLVDMSCCAAFSALLYRFIPSAKPAMLCIGAAYILWLAYSIWRDKPRGDKKGLRQTNSMSTGMLLQFVNVKVILYGVTAMSSFILPHHQNWQSIAAFVVLLAFIGFVGTCCWALFGVIFDRLFKRYDRFLNAGMALLLVYCAASMLKELIQNGRSVVP